MFVMAGLVPAIHAFAADDVGSAERAGCWGMPARFGAIEWRSRCPETAPARTFRTGCPRALRHGPGGDRRIPDGGIVRSLAGSSPPWWGRDDATCLASSQTLNFT